MCHPNHPSKNHRKNRKGSSSKSLPPQLTTSIRFRHKFRFIADEVPSDVSNTSTITANQFCGLLVQGHSLGLSYSTIRSVRILDVEMWAMYAGSTAEGVNPFTPVSLYIEYPNTPNVGPGGPDSRRSDTSMGTATPAHVRYPPPRNSISGQWLNRSDQPVLVLKYPRGAVLDVTLDIVLEDSSSVTAVGTTAAIPGVNYLLALDWGGGGYRWTPVDYNTTQ